MRNQLFLAFLTLSFGVAGCQSGLPMKQPPIDSGSFMSFWNTYSHCKSADDFEQLKHDAVVLGTAAKQSPSQDTFLLALPGGLERFVAMPPPRLAVDIKAMSAACSLRAGESAVGAEQFDVAKRLLQEIFQYQPQSDYAFYSLQARAILAELEQETIRVSLRIP